MYRIESRLPVPGGQAKSMASATRRSVGWICANGCTIKSDLAHTETDGSTSTSVGWRDLDIANPTEEHAMLREMIRDFVAAEVEPQALEHDRDERFNTGLFRSLGNQGLL